MFKATRRTMSVNSHFEDLNDHSECYKNDANTLNEEVFQLIRTLLLPTLA